MKKIIPYDYRLPNLESLSLDQKIAQILTHAIFPKQSFDTGRPNKVEQFIHQYGIGSVHLAYGTLQQTQDWIDHLQELAMDKAGIPILFAADCEQGVPHSFSVGTELPWQMAIGSTGNPELARKAGMVVGTEARAIGIDIVYGPVADVNSNPKNKLIMTRCFGANPETVSEFVRAYVEGLQSAGVIAALKHFPGHGEAEEDSHLTLPHDFSDKEFIQKTHLPPFQAGIEAGAGVIMTGHVVMHAWDATVPATLSSFALTDILRNQLRFEGVLITDSLNMHAIKKCTAKNVSKNREELALQSLIAGADILMHPGRLTFTCDTIKQALQEGTLSQERLDTAVRRVLDLKARMLPYQIAQQERQAEEILFSPKHQDIAQEIANHSITIMGDAPLSVLPQSPVEVVVVIDNAGREIAMTTAFQDRIMELRPGSRIYVLEEKTSPQSWNDVESALRTSPNPLVLGIMCPMMWFKGRSLLPESLTNRLTQILDGLTVQASAVFGSPFILDSLPGKTKLCAYGPSLASQKAAANALLGLLQPGKILPTPGPREAS